MILIACAEAAEGLDAVRTLIREFHHGAMTEVSPGAKPGTFARIDAELAALPGICGAPGGCLLLARLDGAPAGCAGFLRRDAATMDLRRMYVRPAARGHGIGTRLVETLLAKARACGYRRYLLSSHHSMHAAHAIYRRAGFAVVPHGPDFPTAEPDLAICMATVTA